MERRTSIERQHPDPRSCRRIVPTVVGSTFFAFAIDAVELQVERDGA